MTKDEEIIRTPNTLDASAFLLDSLPQEERAGLLALFFQVVRERRASDPDYDEEHFRLGAGPIYSAGNRPGDSTAAHVAFRLVHLRATSTDADESERAGRWLTAINGTFHAPRHDRAGDALALLVYRTVTALGGGKL